MLQERDRGERDVARGGIGIEGWRDWVIEIDRERERKKEKERERERKKEKKREKQTEVLSSMKYCMVHRKIKIPKN